MAALPAYAAFAWEGEAGEYLLVPDLATYPLRLYRPALDHRLVRRWFRGGTLPPLLVATSDGGRVGAWRALLEETSHSRTEAPLARGIFTWDDLRADPGVLATLAARRARPLEELVRRVRLRPGDPLAPGGRPAPSRASGIAPPPPRWYRWPASSARPGPRNVPF